MPIPADRRAIPQGGPGFRCPGYKVGCRSQPLVTATDCGTGLARSEELGRVDSNLLRALENGQAYVALSRAAMTAGMQVIDLEPRKALSHHRRWPARARLKSAVASPLPENRRVGAPSRLPGSQGRRPKS